MWSNPVYFHLKSKANASNIQSSSCPFDLLTQDLVILVFSFLNISELAIITRVNKRFKHLSEDNGLWRFMYEKVFNTVFIDDVSSHDFKRWYKVEMTGEVERQKSMKSYPRNSRMCCSGSMQKFQRAPPHSSIVVYDRERSSAKRRLQQGVKLVILGDMGTGKTCTIVRFCRERFVDYHDATIGASFMIKQTIIENTPIKFEIWDTAGQERYYALAPTYYRGAAAAIIVYDVTHQDSYERALRWIKELQESANRRIVIALAGNKIDLAEKRQVETQTAQTLANEKHLIFMEISAKTGTNIVELFVAIAKELIQMNESD